MTGEEHYAEAERVTRAAMSMGVADAEGFSRWSKNELIGLAQLHATLALAAVQSTLYYGAERAFGVERSTEDPWATSRLGEVSRGE